MPRPKSEPNRFDDIFKALSHSARRLLLRELSESGGASLVELTAVLPFTRQAVTQHLRVLERANVVVVRRHGRERLHYLNSTPLAEAFQTVVAPLIGREADALLEIKEGIERATKNVQAESTRDSA